MNYLPSKKFVIVVLFIGIIITVVLVVQKPKSSFLATSSIDSNNSASNLEHNNEQTKAILQELSNLTTNDSDGDGLANWEEAVFGTDPTKKDTDGNGISDYDETRGKQTSPNGIDSQPKTETDKFSRQFYTEFMMNQQGGVPLEQTQAYLKNEMLNFTKKIRDNIKLSTKTDLNITPQNNNTKILYEQSLTEILLKYKIDVNDVTTMIIGIKDGTFPDNPQLIIQKYQNLIYGLLQTPVPENIVAQHLAFINALQKYLYSLQGMSVSSEDPLLAINGIYNIGNDLKEVKNSFADILQILSNN